MSIAVGRPKAELALSAEVRAVVEPRLKTLDIWATEGSRHGLLPLWRSTSARGFPGTWSTRPTLRQGYPETAMARAPRSSKPFSTTY